MSVQAVTRQHVTTQRDTSALCEINSILQGKDTHCQESKDAGKTQAKQLAQELVAAGIRPGCVLLIHSSLSSIGRVEGGADTVLNALLEAVGPEGTLCLPTLSYLYCSEASPTFNVTTTPSNLGALPNAFLRRQGVIRSLHPTHSAAAIGPQAEAVVGKHGMDRTPVGPHSPFRRVYELEGQVAFLGCGTRCNTSIHGVEELLESPPPYLFQELPIRYTVTDAKGASEEVEHRRHSFETGKPFEGQGTGQRYERVLKLLDRAAGYHFVGKVGGATIDVFEAKPMWEAALSALQKDPLCLVEAIPADSEGHHLVIGSSSTSLPKYKVGPKMGEKPMKLSESNESNHSNESKE